MRARQWTPACRSKRWREGSPSACRLVQDQPARPGSQLGHSAILAQHAAPGAWVRRGIRPPAQPGRRRTRRQMMRHGLRPGRCFMAGGAADEPALGLAGPDPKLRWWLRQRGGGLQMFTRPHAAARIARRLHEAVLGKHCHQSCVSLVRSLDAGLSFQPGWQQGRLPLTRSCCCRSKIAPS